MLVKFSILAFILSLLSGCVSPRQPPVANYQPTYLPYSGLNQMVPGQATLPIPVYDPSDPCNREIAAIEKKSDALQQLQQMQQTEPMQAGLEAILSRILINLGRRNNIQSMLREYSKSYNKATKQISKSAQKEQQLIKGLQSEHRHLADCRYRQSQKVLAESQKARSKEEAKQLAIQLKNNNSRDNALLANVTQKTKSKVAAYQGIINKVPQGGSVNRPAAQSVSSLQQANDRLENEMKKRDEEVERAYAEIRAKWGDIDV